MFDGDGRHLDNAGQTATQNIDPPLLGDIVGGNVLGLGLPQPIDFMTSSNKKDIVGDNSLKPAGVTLNTGTKIGGSGNNLQVQPLFINPGPPITDPDLLSLLRSFPHEMANIPSAMIQSALKNNKGLPKTSEAFSQDSSPITNQIADSGNTILLKQQLPSPPQTVVVTEPKVDSLIKAFPGVGDNIVDRQLFDLSSKDSPLYPELSALATEPLIGSSKKDTKMIKGVASSKMNSGKSTEGLNTLDKTVKNVKSNMAKPEKKTSKPLGVKVSQPSSAGQGIPISIGLFSMWAMS